MSRETAEARAEARQADWVYRSHLCDCPACWGAAERRAYGDMCSLGQVARRARADAEAELARNRELDKQPAPDQPPLDLEFPAQEPAGRGSGGLECR